jgi:hypothetical protein
MTDLFPRELDEAGIAAQQAAARGLLVARLERLYGYCEDNLGGVEDGGADPRFAELAVRIIDRLAKLYRLDRAPSSPDSDELDVVTSTALARSSVVQQLSDLSAKMTGSGS